MSPDTERWHCIRLPRQLDAILTEHHYLGPTRRGFGWLDEYGCLVLAAPTSRRLPANWLELTRWCLFGIRNGGSRQWSRVSRWLRLFRPNVTTIVSYSDPSVGHTGALYKASGWIHAPTWHRLRPPPTGNGSWNGGVNQSVKDRWIFVLAADARREQILSIKDAAVRRRCAAWRERR